MAVLVRRFSCANAPPRSAASRPAPPSESRRSKSCVAARHDRSPPGPWRPYPGFPNETSRCHMSPALTASLLLGLASRKCSPDWAALSHRNGTSAPWSGSPHPWSARRCRTHRIRSATPPGGPVPTQETRSLGGTGISTPSTASLPCARSVSQNGPNSGASISRGTPPLQRRRRPPSDGTATSFGPIFREPLPPPAE